MVTSEIVREVLVAIEAEDWERLKPLLHPYLHWTDGSGDTLRGRSQVLAWLREAGRVVPPGACELRDGQVYRWTQVLS